MAGGLMFITVLGWDKINPRKDVSNPSWFKFKHNFFEDPDFYDFTSDEMLAWLYLLCLASKSSSNAIAINFSHAERIGRLKKEVLESAISKLRRLKIVGTKDDGAQAILAEGMRRQRARRRVKDAVRRGKILKPNSCDGCKKECFLLDAHHQDYDKPLEILWLCKICHGARHAGKPRLTEYARARTGAQNTCTGAQNKCTGAREEKIREEKIREEKIREEKIREEEIRVDKREIEKAFADIGMEETDAYYDSLVADAYEKEGLTLVEDA